MKGNLKELLEKVSIESFAGEDGDLLDLANEYLRLALEDLERGGKAPEEKRKVTIQFEAYRGDGVYHLDAKLKVKLAADYPDLIIKQKYRRADERQLDLIAGGKA